MSEFTPARVYIVCRVSCQAGGMLNGCPAALNKQFKICLQFNHFAVKGTRLLHKLMKLLLLCSPAHTHTHTHTHIIVTNS
jgi:hypothetical protein